MPICSNAITAGIEENCENNVGGLRKVYITDYENVTDIDFTTDDDIIQAITMASTTQFFEFNYARNSAMIEENLNSNLDVGFIFYDQKVALTIPRRDDVRRASIKELTQGQKKLIVIVEDTNGLYWLFFDDEGGIVTTLTGGSGATKDSMNGYSLEITAQSVHQARVVDETIIDALLTPAS